MRGEESLKLIQGLSNDLEVTLLNATVVVTQPKSITATYPDVLCVCKFYHESVFRSVMKRCVL